MNPMHVMQNMSIEATSLLAQHVSAFLESPYKPFLIYLPFIPWAWVISTKLDKDARYFHINAEVWNGIHLAGGAAARESARFFFAFSRGSRARQSSLPRR